jgi:hypothetical protein
VSTEVSDVLGYLFPPRVAVSNGSVVFPQCRPPFPCESGFIPLWAFLSYRVRSCLSPARCPRALGAFLGVPVPFATLACGVHCSLGSQTQLRSVLSVSRTLDGLLLLTPCGLVSSHCHVRDSLFRGFPRCQAGSPHRRVVPSCRFRVSPHAGLPRRCQFHSFRLQGVSPSSDPLWPTGGLDLPTTRSPLGLSTPAGFSPATLETPSRPLRSCPFPSRTRCLRDGWTSAFQSATDLVIYPQTTYPFELCDLPSTPPEGNASD